MCLRQELQTDPDQQIKPCGDANEIKPYQHLYLRAWIQHQIGSKHTTDRAACAYHRSSRLPTPCYLRRRTSSTAQQIGNEKPSSSEIIFDIVAENPEEPHIANQVKQTAVHEHGCEHMDDAVNR